MCDFSLMHLTTRKAEVNDKLTIKNFGSGTSGFANPEGTCTCLLPGTELAFDAPVLKKLRWFDSSTHYTTTKVARFRQINKDHPHMHHDALEFGEGEFILLTSLEDGQTATVLQLPAAPKIADEAKAQERLPIVA